MTCDHDDLQLGSRIDLLVPDEGEPYLLLKLSVRCSGCKQLFSFGGLPSGVPNPEETVVSADGFELRAPIYPRPGATVALIERAGLEDELRAAGKPSRETAS